MTDKQLWGGETAKAVDNFPISGETVPVPVVRWLARVKGASAAVNGELGLLDKRRAGRIEKAAAEIAAGKHDAQFPIDVFQTGSGTSTNMNANEVIAHLAARTGVAVHPNDHVNMGQSSNDVIPTAIHVSAALLLHEQLLPALQHLAGVIAAPLDWAVPAVAPVRGRSLPRGVSSETVTVLLASCDRGRVVGRRDYAIVLLLVRLGLRAGEVAGLGLDDLDWRSGEVLVRGKGGRRDRLPLPVDVGEALADYLRHRPRSEQRAVFLQRREGEPPITRHTVNGLVRWASVRAGVGPVAPHQLRHTAASGMLAAGASLGEIAQVMRHSQRTTTEVYARVDRVALRTVALPWPQVRA